MKKWLWPLSSLGFLLLVALLWQLCANYKLINPLWFPGPINTLKDLWSLIQSGEMGDAVLETVQRMLVGFVLASVIGVVVGGAIASSEFLKKTLEPTVEFFRPMPASALIPVVIIILGYSGSMVVAVVVLGSIWPILLASIHGFRSLDPRLSEVALLLQMSPLEKASKMQLPNALPSIFSGIKVSISIALIVTVAAEMLSSQPGIGYLMLMGARAYQSTTVFSGILVLGVLGLLINIVMQQLEKFFVKWQAEIDARREQG